MQQSAKDASISSYMLKTPFFITKGFKDNKKAKDKLFKNMCSFGARLDWRSRKRVASYYLDVETRKYQDRLLNPNPLDYITC